MTTDRDRDRARIIRVTVILYASATDPYARTNSSGIKGTIQEAIEGVSQTIDVTSLDVTHDMHSQSKDQLATIEGVTTKTLAALTSALYGHPIVGSRMKTLQTFMDYTTLFSTDQQQVPTEDEIIDQLS